MKENELLFSIKLPKFDEFVFLNIKVMIDGIFNDKNGMSIGIANKDHYWAIERDSKNIKWHYLFGVMLIWLEVETNRLIL